MLKVTREFIERCWGEGTYGSVEPTHVRLNPCHESYLKAYIEGFENPSFGISAWLNKRLVFTEEVDPSCIEIVNIKWLRPQYETTSNWGRDHSKPMMFTFSRKIESGLEICPCCGNERNVQSKS
jgi:hypothetical protein